MSAKVIKSDLESYLNNNISDIAIKWSNTSTYTLNNIGLEQDAVNNLEMFLEPTLIAIGNKKGIYGGSNTYKQKNFFQVNIYITLNIGLGDAMDTADRLIELFKEQTINGVVCEEYEYLPYFEDEQNIVLPVRILTHKYV